VLILCLPASFIFISFPPYFYRILQHLSIRMSEIKPIFDSGVGYGIIVGVGALFALGMSLVSWGLSRFFDEKQTSEMFMTAKHSVKIGLTASAVVSSWTIVATLLTSTTGKFYYHHLVVETHKRSSPI
jgi:hypothetical protein